MKKDRTITITLSEMDLEVISMALVDATDVLRDKRERWEASAASGETKDRINRTAFRQLDRLDRTADIINSAKAILNVEP